MLHAGFTFNIYLGVQVKTYKQLWKTVLIQIINWNLEISSETEISTKSLPIPKYQAWVNNHGDSTKEMSEYLNLYK